MADTISGPALGSDREDGHGEVSPFAPARITEGYPFDEMDKEAIERFLSEVRHRQREAEKVRAAPASSEAATSPRSV
jgi:hypothetical protein